MMEEEREKDEKEGGGRIQSLVASTLYPFLFQSFFFFWLCCVAFRVLVLTGDQTCATCTRSLES